MKTKSALSWFGSDSQFGSELAANLDHCNHVTIPFFGGGGIVRHLKAKGIVASDVYRCLTGWHNILNGHKNHGRGGRGGTSSMGGNNNASRLITAANDLPGWADQYKRCEFETISFRGSLPKGADKPKNGYVDLFCELDRFEKATVVIRYDNDPLIRQLYRDPKWAITERESRTQANTNCKEIQIVLNGRAA